MKSLMLSFDRLRRLAWVAGIIGPLCVLGLRGSPSLAPGLVPEEIVIWKRGEGGFVLYRTSGLVVTAAGSLIAYSDARLKYDDGSPSHVVLKRSTDGGRNWGPTVIIGRSTQGENNLNPQIVRDPRSELLRYIWAIRRKANSATETEIVQRTSADDGLTWSEPERIDAPLWKKGEEVEEAIRRGDAGPQFAGENPAFYSRRWLVPTPGSTVTLRPDHRIAPNRIVIPIFAVKAREATEKLRGYGTMTLISDDGGRTWGAGGVIPSTKYFQNESGIIEAENGDLIMNSRAQLIAPNRRVVSRSRDGGMTWSAPVIDQSLPAYFKTQSGFFRISFAASDPKHKGRVLFSCPLGGEDFPGRKNMTVLLSYDDGTTWPVKKTVFPGIAQYSNLNLLPDGTLLLIYGRGPPLRTGAAAPRPVKSANPAPSAKLGEDIVLARFNLEWLTDGKDSLR